MRDFPSTNPRAESPHASALTQRVVRAMVAKSVRFFDEHTTAFIKRVREHLLDLADSKVTLVQGQNLRSAAILLDRQAGAFKQAFSKALLQCMEEEIASTISAMEPDTMTRPASLDELDGMTLSLIDVDEVHRILLLDRVAQPFNLVFEPSLTPLSQRIAALQGVQSTALSINPFRPIVFLKAFMTAWDSGGFDDQATEDLMLAVVPEHSVDLKPLYDDLISMLNQAGVQVDTALRIRKAPNGAPASYGSGAGTGTNEGATAETAATSGSGATNERGSGPGQGQGHSANGGTADSPRSAWSALAPMGRTIATQARAFLHRLGVGQGSHAQPDGSGGMYASGEGAPQAAADPNLMAFLGNMQAGAGASVDYRYMEGQDPADHNILRQMREQEAIRSAPEIDRGTVDALAEVFDYVFSDRAIPSQMKVVIGRLQIPVLKAAMIDRDFFLSGEHPARKLVDTLASASVAWVPEKGESDPLYVQIEHTVQRVLTEFEDDLSLFGDLLLEFTRFLFETEQQAQKNIEPVATQERNDESLAAARAHADDVVREHIDTHAVNQRLAPFLTPFLAHQWREVVANAWLASESTPEKWGRALETMDHLIWSTQPKTTSDDRKKLVEVLPGLVRSLNAGLDEIAWDGDERAIFTKRLISMHMLAIRMKAPPAPDTQAAALEENASQEALQALDQRIADKLAGQIDGYDDAAHGLNRGNWFEFSGSGAVHYRCKLSWISPMRTRFLFTNREGFEAFVRSEREVANMLRLGTLRALDQAPIVSRAIDKLMAVNDEEMQLEA